MLEKLKEILSLVMPEIDTSEITEETRLQDVSGLIPLRL